MKNLRSNCLLISHHGTAIIEGALLGFKIISFAKGFWDKKFRITNTWKNKDLANNYLDEMNVPGKTNAFMMFHKALIYDVFDSDAADSIYKRSR